ncbi:hypothetical protein [Fischerella thermalis]|uniref:hypothetical protein n=1 Tax=Fischerella thermalis TaxID=372787 RepID=UPI00307F4D2C
MVHRFWVKPNEVNFRYFGRSDLVDDLDPEAERQLCQLAESETGIPALFIIVFPLMGRPF